MSQRWKCLIIGHRWTRVRYPGSDSPDGFFLRCRRCSHEREVPTASWELKKQSG